MARVSIYLNFLGQTEAAFQFYADAFGTRITSLQRMREVPGPPILAESELDLVMHAELPILAGAILMGTDVLESMGHTLRIGNNVTINLEPDTLAETERLFAALSEGASEVTALTPQFWGSHWGTCLDQFGVRWMFNSPASGGSQ